jgi:exodeoxyribonuclease VII large subunit
MDGAGVTITQKSYSLHEVMLSVQSVLQKAYASRSYWVRCELSRISLHGQSGHCYLELIDKNETSIVAQMRGILWADKYSSIIEKFRAVTNSPLSGGMKILIQCSVSFHPLHGLSLIISDIEPSFTLGEMARMKNESISKLKAEGLYDQNRKLKLPLLPKRLAIVSVATSRGYQDFITTIQHHHTHYTLEYSLFEAILQGDNAVPTLIRAINKIISNKKEFDAIAIIRGGAGDAGLSCYDEYSLASVIARCPLPVITGIGHASNETVTEMIAFKNCITPTAAATFFLDKFDQQQLALEEIKSNVVELSRNFLNGEKQFLSIQSERFCLIVKNHVNRRHFQLMNQVAGFPARIGNFFSSSRLNLKQFTQTVLNVNKLGKQAELKNDLNRSVAFLRQCLENILKNAKESTITSSRQLNFATKIIRTHKDLLKHITEKTTLLNPVNTLKRGYSITRYDQKAVTDTKDLKQGMKVETELAIGKIISIIEEKK